MFYDSEKDYYVCAAGKKLLFKGTKRKKSKSGFESIVSIYECENCNECQYKNKCTKAKGNKHLHVAKNFMRLRKNNNTRRNSSKNE